MRFYSFAYRFPVFLIGTAAVPLLQTHRVMALGVPEIGQIAKAITVQVESQDHGSGVLLKHDGNTYTVLTAAHVVKGAGAFTVITSDGKQTPAKSNTIKSFAGLDLAILQFSSTQNYPVAQIGDSTKVIEGNPCYVAGFPLKTKAITESIYNFTKGEISANANKPLADGYALVYSNDTLPGMSGGPVLDGQGRLIGIHGRADTAGKTKASDINPNIVVKTGFNLGIPINTFLAAVPKVAPKLVFSKAMPIATTQKTNASDFFLQGGDKYKKGDFKGAIADYDKAIAINPKDAEAYHNRGTAYYIGLKEPFKAIENFDKAIALNSRYALSYYKRGIVYQDLGDYPKAIANYTQAIAIKPEFAEAYNNRGVAHKRLREYPEAIADFTKAISTDPKDATAYANRGNAYFFLKDYSKEILDCSKAIALNPELAEGYANRGIAYVSIGEKQKAKKDLQSAAALFQKQQDATKYQQMMQILNAL